MEGHLFRKKNSNILQEEISSTHEVVFWVILIKVYFTKVQENRSHDPQLTHMTFLKTWLRCASLTGTGTGSVGHDVASATRGPIASHTTSKVERIILKFCIHSSSVKSD